MDNEQNQILQEINIYYKDCKSDYLIKKEEVWILEERNQNLTEDIKDTELRFKRNKDRLRQSIMPKKNE